MSGETLKNPPIIEALVEIKWELKESTPIGKKDPHYQFLLGVFHNQVKSEYPYHEELPASQIPDDVTGSVVKHRFRVGKDEWPLIQIGPGVLTINETKKYDTFDTFKSKALKVIQTLFDSYPDKDNLNIIKLNLRYINAHEFDFSKEKVQDFISSKMHIRSEIPDFFLAGGNIEDIPLGYSLKTSLRCKEPPGISSFHFDTGHKNKKRAIIWNHIFASKDEDVPDMPEGFEKWLLDAHDIIHIWFDGVVEGDLREEFNK